MKFQCPDCGQPLETETLYAGQAVNCPSCGASMTTPVAARPPPASKPPSPEVIRTLQSSIDRGNMTITQFMAQRKIEGGVDLAASDTETTASKILTTEQGRKYKLGEVVAQGGMGAIVDAKDVNLRRDVAMKVILDPDQASNEQVMRFIEEAQVTSQLEHPAIVPVHELGVDASGNVFYTMKFVKGRTLSDILEKIHDGDTETIREYPLSHLLNIFQKVCDAMAFAHSKRVIHRDLKPENVMIGDYGEVQVMDWGLAKVLPRKKRKTFARDEGGRTKPEKAAGKKEFQGSGLSFQPSPAIDSVRSDEVGEVLKTMDGSIMGTPGFMSPEQALGETEKIDERTDIYALGAILYNILTLNVPVKAKNLADLIKKVTGGEIKKPTEYNRATKRPAKDEGGNQKPEKGSGQSGSHASEPSGFKSQVSAFSSLPHLPDNRVPESLSAVTMRALEVQAHRRYQKVKDLQKEIEAYQGGFATSAEQASAWRQINLFFHRHMAVAILGSLAMIGIIGGSIISTTQWIRAEKARGVAVEKDKAARETLAALKDTAPALIAQAQTYLQKGDISNAIKQVNYAAELMPDSPEYHLHKGHMLECALKIRSAAEAYDKAVGLCKAQGTDASNSTNNAVLLSAQTNLALCRKILPDDKDGKLSLSSVTELHLAMRDQNRDDDAIFVLQFLGKDVKSLESLFKSLLDKRGVKYTGLAIDKEGKCNLDLNKTEISDLSLLRGLPLAVLNIDDCKNITDLSPLKGMRLKRLSLAATPVSDLSPLKGMTLTSLNLSNCSRISDLSPLKGLPLTEISLFRCEKVADISPLAGMRLPSLTIYFTAVSDLSPLQGMPLTRLELSGTRVSDLTAVKGMELRSIGVCFTKVSDLRPLEGMELESIIFTPKNIIAGIDTIRAMKSLRTIGTGISWNQNMGASAFWKKYDSGEFK